MRPTTEACPTPGAANFDEPDLVAAARKHDDAAFARLVERYRSRVYSLALGMLRDPTLAEEVMQDTFLSAWQKLPEFRAYSSFGSWLHRICANFCLMRLRRTRLERRTEPQPLGPRFDSEGKLLADSSPDWSPGTEELAMSHELRGAIQDAVAALPYDYRVVFLLKDVEELSYDEIALTLATSISAVKSRLHRARLALREAIATFASEARGEAPGRSASVPRRSASAPASLRPVHSYASRVSPTIPTTADRGEVLE